MRLRLLIDLVRTPPSAEPTPWLSFSPEALVDLLARAHDGEDPELLVVEAYANAQEETGP